MSRDIPSPAQIARAIDEEARARRVPTVIAKGIAWQESRWGAAPSRPGRIGIFGVPTIDKINNSDQPRTDLDRLMTDWRYNIAEGMKYLEYCWNRAPLMGTKRLDESRNILECWFYAVGKYGVGKEGKEAHHYAFLVFDAIRQGGEGTFPPLPITKPAPEALTWGRNLPSLPAPIHFGDVARRSPAKEIVALPMPYVHQLWDTPDEFEFGSGACGPTSMTMVLAFFKKLPPKPTEVTLSYPHSNDFGGYVAELYPKVCEPGRGAIHAKMLDYFRPLFPDVAIFYNERATYARVKAELSAGRPVILGARVTPSGHIIVARGFLSDGRLVCNDPAGDREQAARLDSPRGPLSPTGSRYFSPGGERALYDWDTLQVRWVMTFAKQKDGSDIAEDAPTKEILNATPPTKEKID
jgi:hypothetical protein